MTEQEQREAVTRVALAWLETPYHSNACLKGIGVDCAQLLRGVYVEAGVVAPFDLAPYSPQFYLHSDQEIFMGIVKRSAREIEPHEARPGDVVLYKLGKCFAHGAIIVNPGWPHIVHAHHAAKIVRRGLGTSMHLGMPILGMKFFSHWGGGGACRAN